MATCHLPICSTVFHTPAAAPQNLQLTAPSTGLFVKSQALYSVIFYRAWRNGAPRGGKPHAQPVKSMFNSPQLGFIRVRFKARQIEILM